MIGNGLSGHGTVIVASAGKEDVRRFVGPKQDIVRLYLGSGMEPRPRRRSSGRRRTLIIANFGVFRDPRRVIEASRILRSRRVERRLRMCSTLSGQSRFTPAIPAESLEAEDYIGAVAREDCAQVYAEADLFCYASRYERFGLPMHEAALAGLPLVVSPVGIVLEVQTPKDEVVAGLEPAPLSPMRWSGRWNGFPKRRPPPKNGR